jgi:trehalose 6-phosphate synthase/phosphatase
MSLLLKFEFIKRYTAMGKTIIVSNRLPVSVYKREGRLVYTSSAGGLATGLGAIHNEKGNIWIGWPGIYLNKNQNEKDEIREHLKEDSMIPVFLTKSQVLNFYEGFSNSTLWPLFHHFPKYTSFKEHYWDSYQQVNSIFCEAILSHAENGDTIWIQDYQLMLLPSLIRKHLPECTIAYFQHIPFPSFEIFRVLPWREELLQGLIGADLIGFHTYDDVRHFLSSLNRLLGMDNKMGEIRTEERVLLADAFPLGIDYKKYEDSAKSKKVKKEADGYRKQLAGNKIILSIDRLDYTKGIPERMHAFDLFLQKYPEFIGKVNLVMIVVPSREKVEFYEKLKHEIDELVGRINAKYRTMEWTPILYFYRAFSLTSLSAFYTASDVALITPLRDGMNLVAKEYIASRIDKTGVLILSEMAGAAKELSEALIINPNNIKKSAEAIYMALEMPREEQIRRNEELQTIVKKYDVHHWVKIFMKRLEDISEKQKVLALKHFNSRARKKFFLDYKKSIKRIFFLDYDGTLVSIKDKPDKASPDKELYHLLDILAEDNTVVLISGRDKFFLEKWFGGRNIHLVAEHGAWRKDIVGDWIQDPTISNQWKSKIIPILDIFVDRTPGSFMEEKDFSLAWHYRKADYLFGEQRARELAEHLQYAIRNFGLSIVEGKKIIEIKNAIVGKGTIVQRWLKDKYDFIFAAGDDLTDEDIFNSMPSYAYTFKIGFAPSLAKFNIKASDGSSISELREMLKSLCTENSIQI